MPLTRTSSKFGPIDKRAPATQASVVTPERVTHKDNEKRAEHVGLEALSTLFMFHTRWGTHLTICK